MRIKTIVLTGLGFLFLGLGAIGLLIPVWPTTPFILVSFACFSSSPQMRSRIMRIPFFKEHIDNYTNRNGLSNETIWKSLIWLWGTMTLSILIVQKMWLTFLLIGIGILVTLHILYISKAKHRDKKE